MPTVRLILEFEVSAAALDLKLANRIWGSPDQVDGIEGTGHYPEAVRLEKLLAEVVDADPALQRQAVLNTVLNGAMYQLEEFELKGLTPEEAMKHSYRPLLPGLLSRLPQGQYEAVQQYCEESGLLDLNADFSPLAQERVSLHLSRVLVEDEQGLMATSDERTRKWKKKRR